MIPESQYSITFGLKTLGTLYIVCDMVGMLSTVYLNGKPFLHADEIHHIFSYRMLSTKSIARKLVYTQFPPQQLFCIR